MFLAVNEKGQVVRFNDDIKGEEKLVTSPQSRAILRHLVIHHAMIDNGRKLYVSNSALYGEDE